MKLRFKKNFILNFMQTNDIALQFSTYAQEEYTKGETRCTNSYTLES